MRQALIALSGYTSSLRIRARTSSDAPASLTVVFLGWVTCWRSLKVFGQRLAGIFHRSR